MTLPKLSLFTPSAQARILLLTFLLILTTTNAVGQIWIAATGTVDEGSTSKFQFNGGAAFIKSSVTTGSVILRYNVLPVGDFATPSSNAHCRAIFVRYLDNGSGAQVTVALKRYNVRTGAVSTVQTFDSDAFSPQSGFQ